MTTRDNNDNNDRVRATKARTRSKLAPNPSSNHHRTLLPACRAACRRTSHRAGTVMVCGGGE